MADLSCGECGALLTSANDQLVKMRARARRWKVFTGVSVTGAPIDVVMCDKCCRAPFERPTVVLEGQIPLWTENDEAGKEASDRQTS